MRLILSALLIMLSLSGCRQPDYDYQELMTKPALLARAIDYCKSINFMTENCKLVHRASSDFQTLINTRARNPLAFGWIVLNAESNLEVFQKLYKTNKNRQFRRAYEAQQLKVNVLLAVLEATSTDF